MFGDDFDEKQKLELAKAKAEKEKSNISMSAGKLFAGGAVLAAIAGVATYFFSSKGDEFFDLLNAKKVIPPALDHIFFGDFKSTDDLSQPSGGHSTYYADKVRVFGNRQKFPSSDFGYFAQGVEIYNDELNTWIPKKTKNFYTMFDDNWNEDILEEQLVSAYKNRTYFTKKGDFTDTQIRRALDKQERGEENPIFYEKHGQIFAKTPLMWYGTSSSDLIIEGYLFPLITAYPIPYIRKKFAPRWK